jgi:adenylate cyclase
VPRLALSLLGSFQADLGGRPITTFESAKARALLAYLAVESERPHTREKLAGLLWPDSTEAAARASLSQALSNLRSALSDRDTHRPILLSTSGAIQFNREGDASVDVQSFIRLLGYGEPSRVGVADLEQAVSLYRGTFLEGFSLPGCAEFEEWLRLEQEHLRRLACQAVAQLAGSYEEEGDFECALTSTWRLLELDPLREGAHRQAMRLLARLGRRAAAIAQYQACCRLLAAELGAEPSTETLRLYEQVCAKQIAVRPGRLTEAGTRLDLPGFVTGPMPQTVRPVFVGRERDLAWLDGLLERALSGRGQVGFVAGGPGRGKTALVQAFARSALDAHPDLLVAMGQCNPYAGVGDPYLPFRGALAMLTGDSEAAWAAFTLSAEQARRMWDALPEVVPVLTRWGSDLVGTLVSGRHLLARACAVADAGERSMSWLSQLERLADPHARPPGGAQQSHLFEQYANVLLNLSVQHPLLLIVDDLQWADRASIGLLFHLARRIDAGRILLLGAYRPSELAAGRDGQRHPLEPALAEIRIRFGDAWLDLADSDEREGRRFVGRFLDSEPNALDERFRQALFDRTHGHALFTIELLRAMQQRGDLVKDQTGRWAEGGRLEWDQLPVRVEAVIEGRIGRLSEDLRETLLVASVEGEEFTAQVVARVRELRERLLLRALTQELVKRHRLVREEGEDRVGHRLLSRYRFAHALFQHYLYNSLGAGERRLLHAEVAGALEDLFEDRRDEIAVQLAFHYCQAGAEEKAVPYLIQAGHQAQSGFAHAEAIQHYTQALEILDEEDPRYFDLLAARAAVYDISAQRVEQKADVEAMLALAQELGDEVRRCDGLLALFDYYLQTEHYKALDPIQEALEIAEGLGDTVRQAQAIRRLGSLSVEQDDYQSGQALLERAMELFDQADLSAEVARCLHILSLALSNLGRTEAAMQAAEKSVALSHRAGDRRQEATGLRRLAIAYGPQPRSQTSYEEALLYVERALALHRELGDRGAECSALNVLGITRALHGDDAAAAERDFHLSLEIAESIDFSVGMSFAISNLGYDCHFQRGEFQDYLMFLEESIVRAMAREDEWLVGSLLRLKGVTLATFGQYQAARSALERSLGVIDRVGSGSDEARVRCDLAAVYTCLADYARARQELRLAAAIARKTGDGRLLHEILFGEALIALREDNLETMQAGLERVKEGLAAASERERDNLRTGYCIGARLHLALGDIEQAEECSQRAVDLVEEPINRWNPEEVWLTHSRVLRARGHEAEADGYLRRAYDRVMLVVSKTTDPELKQSWLENVPDHREIVAEWEARWGQDFALT